MISGLWAALMGLLVVMGDNPWSTVAVILMLVAMANAFRMYRRIRKDKRNRESESSVVRVAFGEITLSDLSKREADCDFYVQAEYTEETRSCFVFERSGEGNYRDRHGGRWHRYESDEIIARNGSMLAVLASTRLPSSQSMSDMIMDLNMSSTWDDLGASTRTKLNEMNPMVSFVLTELHEITLPVPERPRPDRTVEGPSGDIVRAALQSIAGNERPPSQRSPQAPVKPRGRRITLD